MSGFATGIETESGLKTVYFSTFCDFFGVFTALPVGNTQAKTPTDLFSNWRFLVSVCKKAFYHKMANFPTFFPRKSLTVNLIEKWVNEMQDDLVLSNYGILGGSGAVRKPHLPGRGIQMPQKNGKLNSPEMRWFSICPKSTSMLL